MAQRKGSVFKIGITGSTCTGKSLVLKMVQNSGISTLDAEEMLTRLLAENPQKVSAKTSTHFGEELLDSHGRLSSKKLTSILYTDPERRAFFDAKLNPLLREEIKRFLYSPIGGVIRAVEAPLLFETDTQHLYDEVWMVTAQPDVQIKRIMKRDHLTMAQAQYLIDAQWPQDKKAAMSDRVIDNSGDIPHIEGQVRKILDEIRRKVFNKMF
ncbi:MAG TPA: dephospho-CoA kinase [Oculatellaceae cyanobacterium]|jgi:dephospho-CoA kinase